MRRPCLWAVAGLSAALLPAVASRADDPQQEKSFEKEIVIKIKYNYLLYLPPDYEKSDKPFPLVLFLHGAGETGTDVSKVKSNGPPKLIAGGKNFPFIVVSPQSPGMGWNPEALNALLDDVIAHYRVDKDRVYVTGLSMGGGGTLALASAYPDRFAAIAPICAAFRRAGAGRPRSSRTSPPGSSTARRTASSR